MTTQSTNSIVAALNVRKQATNEGSHKMAAYSKGLEGVIASDTKLSYIDGEKGVLEYVGIAIGELAEHSTFEESVFLLWNGRLPNTTELEAFNAAIRAKYDLPEGFMERIRRKRLEVECPKPYLPNTGHHR